MPKAQKITPYRTTKRFGIQNHVGGIWTPETFDTMKAAQKYLDDRKCLNGGNNGLGRHKVIPVRVTVSAIAERGGM